MRLSVGLWFKKKQFFLFRQRILEVELNREWYFWLAMLILNHITVGLKVNKEDWGIMSFTIELR